MSNAELDAMIEREGLMKSFLVLGAILLFGWIIFNDAQRPAESFDTTSLVGCYWSQQGLGLRLEADSLQLLPGGEGPIAYGISREKIGLTVVPEVVITVEFHPERPAFRTTSSASSRWIPNLTLRRFAPEARYTVTDIARANGFTMLAQADARPVDFYHDPLCKRRGGGQTRTRLQ